MGFIKNFRKREKRRRNLMGRLEKERRKVEPLREVWRKFRAASLLKGKPRE